MWDNAYPPPEPLMFSLHVFDYRRRWLHSHIITLVAPEEWSFMLHLQPFATATREKQERLYPQYL